VPNIQRRGKRWRVQIRLKGCRPVTETFDRRTDAVRWAAETETQLRRRRHFPSREDRERTVSDLIARYRREKLPEYSRREQAQRDTKLTWWNEQLGDMRLVELTAADITECRGRLKSGDGISGKPVGPATQTHYLAVIKHVLSVARRDWEWLTDDPGQRARTPKEPRGRVRYLSAEEKSRLIAACRSDSQLYALVVAALATGARQGELLRLRWRHVDLASGTAALEDTKNGDRRTATLLPPVIEALRALVRRLDRDEVFVGPRGGVSFPQEAWTAALRTAGIEDFRFHDLRHTFASYLAMSGATLAELAEALGHKTLAMVKRYAHLTEQHTSEVVRRMGQKFLL
jgi:integrase